ALREEGVGRPPCSAVPRSVWNAGRVEHDRSDCTHEGDRSLAARPTWNRNYSPAQEAWGEIDPGNLATASRCLSWHSKVERRLVRAPSEVVRRRRARDQDVDRDDRPLLQRAPQECVPWSCRQARRTSQLRGKSAFPILLRCCE